MKKSKLIAIALFIFLIFASCKKASESSEIIEKPEVEHTENEISVSKAQFKSAEMVLGKLIKQSFPTLIKVTGVIDAPPQSKAVITSYYAGNVNQSNLLIGDKVRKGELLVTISNPNFIDMQQEFLEISEQLGYLKTEYDRQKILFDEKITSQKNYLKAKSEYNRQKARYIGLQKKLQMININPESVKQGKITSTITLYSPINGYVTKVNVSKGTYVSPQDIVLEIVNTDHIHIELNAFEKDVLSIKKGQKINFKIPEASSDTFEAEVHLVGTTINEINRTIKVHGHLHHEKKNTFAIGMFVDADIEIKTNKSLSLPEDAVVEDGKHQVILKLKKEENGNYIFERIEVEVGSNYANFIQINSDKVKPTDTILIKGAFNLVGGEEGGGHSH